MMVSNLRVELAKFAQRVLEEKLATGAGGNISARLENMMLISPSGFSLEDVAPNQYVEVNILTGEVAPDALRPSSEVLMHLACYRQRPDIRAVIHTHAPYTIALTSSGHNLKPMFADSIIYLGRHVPHIDYITVTTPELAAEVENLISRMRLCDSAKPWRHHRRGKLDASILACLHGGRVRANSIPGHADWAPQIPGCSGSRSPRISRRRAVPTTTRRPHEGIPGSGRRGRQGKK